MNQREVKFKKIENGKIMTKSSSPKVVVIGFDGIISEFLQKFSKKGKLPYITSLIENGVFAETFPCPPCDTPTNWTTIMTGAWPGTHGVTSFFAHISGEPLDCTHPTTVSSVSQAEFLWDMAERKGKKCVLLNYPLSWPPTIKKGIVIGGTEPSSAWWRISYADTYTVGEWEKENIQVKKEAGPIFGEQLSIRLEKASGWINLPKSYSPPLEAAIPLRGTSRYKWSEVGWKLEEKPSSQKRRIFYYILVIGSENSGYDEILISKSKDAAEAVATLKLGEWSDWLREIFHREEILSADAGIGEDRVEGTFKFKLESLSPNAQKMLLYRTDIWITKGWAYPEGIEKKINKDIRPFTEGLEIVPPSTRYFGNWNTYFEQLEEQVDWYVKAVAYFKTHYNPDLLAVQIHVQDAINHVILRDVYSESLEYTQDQSEKCWQRFEKSYVLVDKLVGGITRKYAGENVYFVIVSDHGAIPTTKRAWLSEPLNKAELLAYRKDKDSGKLVVDWPRTKAFPYRTYIWVNLKGRDPNGIVSSQEYERVRDRIITSLYTWRCPETGECPVQLVLRKEDAVSLGQWGPKVGDLMYYLKPGYTDADADYASLESQTALLQGVSPTQVGCAHHQYLPWAKLGDFSVRGILILSGPGIKRNLKIKRPVWMVDIAPTLAYLLGIPAPRQAEGNAIGIEISPDTEGESLIRKRKKEGVYTEEEEEDIRGRLRGLGYFE